MFQFSRKIVAVGLCLVFVVFSSGALSTASISDEAPTSREIRWQDFADNLKELHKNKRIPGLAYAVVRDKHIVVSGGFGFADSNRTVAVTEDTPFWIASVTKPFVALSFLQLREQKKINLSELASNTPNFDGLCHWLAGTTIPFAKGLDCAQPINIHHILTHQVNAPVGTKFMYNPIMYSRLSRYLEHKFGKGVDAVEGRHNYLGQHIEQHILKPLDMTRTMASMWDTNKARVYQEMADGFKITEEKRKVKLRRPDKHIAGGAGMVSTVNDLAKFEAALNSGELLSDELHGLYSKPQTFKDGRESPYGFGWYFQDYQAVRLMWHSGWDEEAGYSALYLRVPDKKMAFIVLANSEGIWWHNPLDAAQVEKSEFAQLFLRRVLD